MLVVILIACILMIISNILFFCIILEHLDNIDRNIRTVDSTYCIFKMMMEVKLDTIIKQIRSLQRK